jgi:hypothetical protein
MAITPTDLQTEFPATSRADDPVLQRASTAPIAARRRLGHLVDDGALYLAAHFRMVSKRGSSGPAGPVKAKKVGEVSVTYAVPVHSLGADAGSLGSTAYGLEFSDDHALPNARFAVDESDNFFDQITPGAIVGEGF